MYKRNLLTGSAATMLIAASFAAPAYAQLVDEIIVTATKRAETLSDVPIAVAALNSETLEELNINVFTDYLVQLPGVSAGGSGPGQGTIYIRGIASTTPALTVAGVAGLAPNVSFYLDEQPLSQPGRNLDVYAADLERIEVLSGPQGTLFGASSQAGTVRLITNKPKIGVEEAAFKFGTSFTKGGEASYNAEAVYNVPVGENTAVRAVVYYDDQGGYIDNVAGTASVRDAGRFRTADTVRSNGTVVGANRAGFQALDTVAATDALLANVNFIEADNSAFVEDDFNDASYFGFRVSALHEFNDDWSISLGYAHQELDVDGVFFIDPSLGNDLEISRFQDEELEDDFDNINWTLKGRVAGLEAIYTGAYTERDSDQIIDYTDYLFVSQYIPYYTCDGSVSYPGAAGPTGTCFAPDLFVDSQSETEVQTHEFRLSTPAENRWRATAGVFYSDLELREVNNFTYIGSTLATGFSGLQGFSPDNFSASDIDGVSANVSDSGPFLPGQIFRNDVLRTDEQFGIFGEATYDFNDQFALTVGARYYDVEVDLEGSAAGSFGNFGAASGDNNAGNNLDFLFSDEGAGPDTASTNGVIFKATGTYTPNSDLLFYGTFSQGFRPGLLNRPGGAQGPDGFTVPFAIDTDDVNNFEFGWKTTLADNQLRFNGAAFYVDISDLQTTIFDPTITNLFFSDNAADAEIFGVEGDLTYAPRAIEGLTVSAAYSFLDSEITNVITPTGDVIEGDELAFAPTFSGNLRARYEWTVGNDLTGHVQPSIVYSAASNSDILQFNTDRISGYTQVGLALGVSAENWSGEIFANNLLDSTGELSRSFGFDQQRATPVKPRTIGARVAYNFR